MGRRPCVAIMDAAPPRAYFAAMSDKDPKTKPKPAPPARKPDAPKELGGPKGPEPTRFGDWERDGRCVDF